MAKAEIALSLAAVTLVGACGSGADSSEKTPPADGSCVRATSDQNQVGFDCLRSGQRIWVVYKGTGGLRVEYSKISDSNNRTLVMEGDNTTFGPVSFEVPNLNQTDKKCKITGTTSLGTFNNSIKEAC